MITCCHVGAEESKPRSHRGAVGVGPARWVGPTPRLPTSLASKNNNRIWREPFQSLSRSNLEIRVTLAGPTAERPSRFPPSRAHRLRPMCPAGLPTRQQQLEVGPDSSPVDAECPENAQHSRNPFTKLSC